MRKMRTLSHFQQADTLSQNGPVLKQVHSEVHFLCARITRCIWLTHRPGVETELAPLTRYFGRNLERISLFSCFGQHLKRQTRLLCSYSSKPSYNSAKCFSLESFFIPSHCSQAYLPLVQKEYEASLQSLRQALDLSLKQVPDLPQNPQCFPVPASPTKSSCRPIIVQPSCLGSHLPKSQSLLRAFSFGSSWASYTMEPLRSLFLWIITSQSHVSSLNISWGFFWRGKG